MPALTCALAARPSSQTPPGARVGTQRTWPMGGRVHGGCRGGGGVNGCGCLGAVAAIAKPDLHSATGALATGPAPTGSTGALMAKAGALESGLSSSAAGTAGAAGEVTLAPCTARPFARQRSAFSSAAAEDSRTRGCSAAWSSAPTVSSRSSGRDTARGAALVNSSSLAAPPASRRALAELNCCMCCCRRSLSSARRRLRRCMLSASSSETDSTPSRSPAQRAPKASRGSA
mmetsp:Transcript_94588/g.210253  ORF Transcript_94588/g.210253 Transcript_94588/m.210253 type:complete len:231 (-) Transcript_94588:77-769(-)